MTDLPEIKARLAAATPGPWVGSGVRVKGVSLADEQLLSVGTDQEQFIFLACGIRTDGGDQGFNSASVHAQSLKDQRLIAHAPTDLAWLIRELEAARERERWRPIAEAPLDGRTVMVGRWMEPWGFVRGLARWVDVRGISGWVTFAAFSDPPGVLGLGAPTHFRPLPAGPGKEE